MTAVHVTSPPGGWTFPWPLVVEVAATLPAGSWVLVGGLMVQLHARAAGVDEVRPTGDVDALVDVLAAGVTVATIAGLLAGRGFEVVVPKSPDTPVHRLRRADDLLGALVLKGAAHKVDRRDPQRHLRDAALLASLITDHRQELARLQGSDRKRLRHLREALRDPRDDAWLLLPADARQRGQDTLRILST